jgi:phenylacetate-coenzyme A ligase PaaK-like adenylate-forming protein
MTGRLISRKDAFNHGPENDGLFLEAMRENLAHHICGCEAYGRLCRREGFGPGDLKTTGDLFSIPHIFVGVFKRRKLLSIPEDGVKLVLRSSGTSGEKSSNYLDEVSLRRIRRIVRNIYGEFGMADRSQKVNYLCFTYDPAHARDVGTAFSDRLLSTLTGVNRIYYALEYDRKSGDFRLNRETTRKVLEEYSKEGLPLRILGFPSFLHEVVGGIYRERGKPFRFNRNSFVIIGGGWKTLAGREIPKPEFRDLVRRWLGIPPENVRDLYGLVEHGIPYCECENWNLHVPIYARACARDPGTLRPLPRGETGLLHLLTPYLNSVPALSLLTSDLGTVLDGCPCGRNAPYIVIAGRGGVHKHRGCAISALDLLEQS